MVLSVLLLAMCLFAQGGSEDSAPEPEQKAAAPTQDGKIIVPYWRCYTGKSAEFVDGIIEEFNASQDKYVVIPEYNGGYYDQFAKRLMVARD